MIILKPTPNFLTVNSLHDFLTNLRLSQISLTAHSYSHMFNHMVELDTKLDTIFRSLADPTRRDMLRRLRPGEQTVGALANHYELTFAAVSKHL